MATAEKKYNLALVQTQTEKRIQHQPWYKERLHTKYVKSLKPTDTSQYLIGKNWTFVKDGLDDFRDGLPPIVKNSDFIKMAKGPGPTLTGRGIVKECVKQPAQSNRFTKYQICFSRISPLQQQRRDNIDEIEYGLLQHPLALYPHLEDTVPPEMRKQLMERLEKGRIVRDSQGNLMFEDIVDVLDPEMREVEEEDHLPEENDDETERKETGAAADTGHEDMAESVQSEKSDEVERVRNPYRWLRRKEEKDKKDRRNHREKSLHSLSQTEHIQKVTKEFCQWVADLGGESNNIEESTVTSLFASGYETKPALSVPIHVVELTNVPPELRMSANMIQTEQTSDTKITAETEKIKPPWNITSEPKSNWMKFKYGAWYLPPITWQKKGWDEQLIDPMVLKEQEMTDAKKKSQLLNKVLASMHASSAFIDFINKKAVRKPEFLEEVEEMQRNEEEEQRKVLEAELLAKQKKTIIPKLS